MTAVLVRWLRTSLLLLLAVAVSALCAAWPQLQGHATHTAVWAAPHPLAIALGALYMAIATFGAGRARAWWRLAASAALLCGWSSFRVLTMGDGAIWRKQTLSDQISYAEPLSSFLYGVVNQSFGAGAIEWVSPALGFVTTYAWLLATDRLTAELPADRRRLTRATAAALWASSGLLVVFCYRYVEQSQLGVPLLLIGLSELITWTKTEQRRRLITGGALISLAALAHLQYAGMAIAAFGSAVIVATTRGAPVAAKTAGWLAVTFAAALAATCGLIAASPFGIVQGSVMGGEDGQLLASSLFAADRLAVIAEALNFAAPLALPLSLAALWRLRALHRAPVGDLVLVAPALAYVVFLAIFGFDLGWPRDLDLMVSMSISLSLGAAALLLPAVARIPKRLATAAALLVIGGAAWSGGISAQLVRPAWVNLSQQNSSAATLLIASMDATGQEVPLRVNAASGDEFELQLFGPPGHSYWVLKGAPAQACEGDPYGSMVDIEMPLGIQSAFVQFGVLDESGRATVDWVLKPLADGRWPGIQMMTFPGTDHTNNTTSAAIYFEPR